jgi:hypothetical protein
VDQLLEQESQEMQVVHHHIVQSVIQVLEPLNKSVIVKNLEYFVEVSLHLLEQDHVRLEQNVLPTLQLKFSYPQRTL